MQITCLILSLLVKLVVGTTKMDSFMEIRRAQAFEFALTKLQLVSSNDTQYNTWSKRYMHFAIFLYVYKNKKIKTKRPRFVKHGKLNIIPYFPK